MIAAWTQAMNPFHPGVSWYSRRLSWLVLSHWVADPEMGMKQPDHETPLLEEKRDSSKSFNHLIQAYFQSLLSSDSFFPAYLPSFLPSFLIWYFCQALFHLLRIRECRKQTKPLLSWLLHTYSLVGGFRQTINKYKPIINVSECCEEKWSMVVR